MSAAGTSTTPLTILHAYRHLLRTSLIAIQYSSPARHSIRWRLRLAFRKSSPSEFDPARIRNTLQFLANARVPRSLEKRVLRSLLHTWYWEELSLKEPTRYTKKVRSKKGSEAETEELRIRERSMEGFRWLVRMLNESMGMCIK